MIHDMNPMPPISTEQNEEAKSIEERNFVRHILKQNDKMTLMDYLQKKNKTKSFLGFGKNIRFFVLDFTYQKFYYKHDDKSQDFKIICSFGQIEGFEKFIVDPNKLSVEEDINWQD